VSLSDVMERLALGPNGGTDGTAARTAQAHAPPHTAPIVVLACAHGLCAHYRADLLHGVPGTEHGLATREAPAVQRYA
jgi:hypothetical protein